VPDTWLSVQKSAVSKPQICLGIATVDEPDTSQGLSQYKI